MESASARDNAQISNPLMENRQPESTITKTNTTPETATGGTNNTVKLPTSTAHEVEESSSASDIFIPSSRVTRGKRAQSPETLLGGISLLSLLLSCFIALAVWLPLAKHHGVTISTASGIIGGRMTQPQAKIIDFICSAILAPATLAAFEFIWFGALRVMTINESNPRAAVPIEVLAEVSATDTGSYNPIKAWGFLRTRKWTIILFGLSVLVSAGAKSLLGNFIAYEAFTGDGASSSVNLAYLPRSPLQKLVTYPNPDTAFGPETYNFTQQQQADFSGQLLGVLNRISFLNGSDFLDGDYYIGINATQASLSAVPASAGKLMNVPGYRLSAQCWQSPPLQDQFGLMQGLTSDGPMLASKITFFASVNDSYAEFLADRTTSAMYTAQYRGTLDHITDVGGNDLWPFMGFPWFEQSRNGSAEQSQMYLGFMYPLTLTNQSIQSPKFGYMNVSENLCQVALTNYTQNITLFTFGVACQVTRQGGSHNLTRLENGTWTRESSLWNDNVEYPRLDIGSWPVDLSYQAVGAQIPGFGPLFATSGYSLPPSILDFPTFIGNALYAVGETERITLEVYAQNPSPGTNINFPITSVASDIFYRITYVPLILLGGILCALVASLIPLGLYLFNWSKMSQSFREWRKVNVVRLLVDATDCLYNDSDIQRPSVSSNNDALKKWAESVNVIYAVDVNEKGEQVVQLRKSAKA